MSQHRFFVSPDQIDGSRLTLDGSQARQIHNVLRMRAADHILALDNSGWQYDVCLDSVASDRVIGEIVSKTSAAGEPRAKVTLYQALLKKDNFEWVLQKGTEIGISSFVPMITKRCVVRQERIKPVKIDRWQRIINEAAEQSGRGQLPFLSPPLMFAEVLRETAAFDMVLVPWERETGRGLAQAVREAVGERPPRIAILIGPEGGFDDEEIEQAVAAKAQPVTLGSRILRAETAALVAATLALSALGELD